MTGALCLAAAAGIEGTVITDLVGEIRHSLRVRHPLGVTHVEAEPGDRPGSVRSLGVVRTARRLMDGRVHPRPHSPSP